MRHAAAWLAWTAALFWLWLLLAGDWNRVEFVAAVTAAALAGAVAEAGRARLGARLGLAPRELAAAWRTPLQIAVDFGILAWALVLSAARREVVRGGFHERRLEPGSGGLSEWAATLSPNAYVVELDRHAKTVLVHDLLEHRHSESPL